jgi:demethylmenaquinone methyltransferase/2-methoxy-6-polyprenyl-1,4-benzoquinol methylase
MRLKRNGELPVGEEKVRAVRGLFDAISDRYDLVNRVITFGMDVGWRRRTVAELRLPGRALVLDLACGTGDICRELEAAGYSAVGFDFSHGMLTRARTRAQLVEADILRLPLREASCDGVTCGFALRNVVSLSGFFSELARVVREGGRVALLETSRPGGGILRLGHSLYFERIVPLIGAVLSDREAYSYLPRSMAYLPPPERIVAMLQGEGFPDARRVQLSGGLTQLFLGTRA